MVSADAFAIGLRMKGKRMWDVWNSPAILSAFGNVSVYIAFVAALTGALAGAAGTIASNRANDILTRKSNEAIARANVRAAEANARAQAAKVEAARITERIEKLQRIRTLTPEQIDELRDLFKGPLFQNPKPKRLRFSTIEDTEARMFAHLLQDVAEECGLRIYPTEGGWPRTVVQRDPALPPLLLSWPASADLTDIEHLLAFYNLMQRFGFEISVEHSSEMTGDEAVLNVLRRRAA